VVASLLRNLCSSGSKPMLAQAPGFCHRLFWGLGIGLGFVALAATSDPSKSDPLKPDLFSSAWFGTAGDKAQMRLIAGTARGQGRYTAAAEIKLVGSAVTYWRQPGDAGVPPTFSFQGSTNLATAEVAYPAPLRINEQGLEAFGYRGDVTFPIAIAARDPAKPVHLRLTLDYAVCDNICLPAKSIAELELPQRGVSGDEKLIAEAAARVPAPLTKAAAAQEFVITADQAAARPTWLLDWKGPEPTDVFAEAPNGWDIETHRLSARRFSLVAVQQPLQGLSPRISTQLTMTTAGQSYVFSVDLDLPAQASTSGAK
jgi:DsbC/DsbD-like thiol-disulfide interchange protein